ncbi:acyl carrier protein [bacterium]|jgi:acyl carrier protein|nr:acyl carrier protein [bacterium]NBW56487.1 acyl carrier protein [bacterium]NBX71542.1 acyl carrier protein [bacterium]
MSEEQLVNTIQSRVYDIIATSLKIDRSKITPTSNIVDDLGADSLDQVELIMALEEEFELNIPEDEVEKFKNIQQIIDCVTSKVNS